MANNKQVQENQKKLLKKISSLRSNNQKSKKISQRREVIIDKNITETEKNLKEIQDAKQKNQITEEQANNATFLNQINFLANGNLEKLDNTKLESINNTLKQISKQITDYTKATIDKQDTSIKKAEKEPIKASEATQSKPEKPKEKDKKSFLSKLLGFLGLGLGLLPFISAISWVLRVARTFLKLGAGVTKGIFKGLLWLGANIANLAKLSGRIILGIVELVTHPVRWFNNYLKAPIYNMVRGMIGNILSKIPILKNTEFVKKFNAKTESLKAQNKANKAQAKNEKINKIKDTAKSGANKVKDFAKTTANKGTGLWAKISKHIPGILTPFKDKIRNFFNKVESFAKSIWKTTKAVFGKIFSILKGPGKAVFKLSAKVIGRALGIMASLMAGPLGWIVTIALTAWMLCDFLIYMFWDYSDKDWTETLIPAFVYSLIGIDILKDKQAWESVEPINPEDANKISNNLTNQKIKALSPEETAKTKEELSKEIAKNKEKLSKLYNKTILYKDKNGNVLSLEESRKIQEKELQNALLEEKRLRTLQEKINRKDNANYLDGEVLISPENLENLVNYQFDKLKNSSFFDHSWWGDMSISKMEEGHKHWLELANQKLNELKSNGVSNDGLTLYSEYKARADIYEKMIELYKSGTKNETDAQKILRGIKKYQTLDDELNAIAKEQGDIQRQLNNYQVHSEQSKNYAEGFKLFNNGTSLSSGDEYSSFGTGSPRAVAAANYALAKAGTKSQKKCAEFVNNAIVYGGKYKGYGRGHGFQVASSLAGIGWTQIPFNSSYKPKIGDVISFNRSSETNATYGHAQIFTREGWVSDFKQNKLPNPITPYGERGLKHISVWRDTGKSEGYNFEPMNSYAVGSSGKDGSITPNTQTPSNPFVLPKFEFVKKETPKAPVIINTQTAQIPKNTTYDLTSYWTLQV